MIRSRRQQLIEETLDSYALRLEALEQSYARIQVSFEGLQRAVETLDHTVRDRESAIVAIEGVSKQAARVQPIAEELATLRDHLNPPLGLHPDFGFELATLPDGTETIGFTENDVSIDRAERYRAFEDVFRGPESVIQERQALYVPLIRDHAPVLDIGCGRGEFLVALREAGVEARGIDLDEGMVARCLDRGLNADLGDALDHLAQQKARTIGAIFAAQVIEHLDHETTERLFDEAARVLRPGGVFIAETVNPHSIVARKAFWLDRTHHSPVFPEVSLSLARAAGFQRAHVLFPNASGVLEADRRSAGDYALFAYAPA